MKFRRLIAFVLSLSIVLPCIPVHTSAHDVDDTVETILSHSVVPFETMVVRSMQSIGNVLDTMQEESFAFIRNVYEFWSGLFYEELDTYFDWVSGLDRTDARSYLGWSGYVGLTSSFQRYYNFSSGLQSLNFPFFYFLRECGIAEKVMVLGGLNSSLLGFYFDTDGILNVGIFTNPSGAYNAVYCTMYDFNDLELVESYMCTTYSSGYKVFFSEAAAKSYSSYLSTNCAVIDWDKQGYYFHKTAQYYFYAYCFTKDSSSAVFSTTSTELNPEYGYDSVSGTFSRLSNKYLLDSYTLDDSFVVEQPSNTDSASRPSSLMSAINQYNIDNSYTDNSTNVNYYIVPTGVDPSSDTAASPLIYDEETLAYTDPVTGTEYLTNGWTYDYLTRCYTLDMADDSYLIGDTVIDTIKLTYGDELLTVDHYSSGSLIQSDEYNYVMMSGSECALNGHTYNITGTQDPTCIAAGSRTYTCSVCGNQYVEAIPMNDHAYGEFAVVQDPTCTAPGIHSFTCSTCGGQYTDTIPALGHDWQPTASTEEAYVMPDNVSCPDCHGTDCTWMRQDLELKTGKNLFDISQVPVQLESASSAWISTVGKDYFIISEPDGYSSSGGVYDVILLSDLAPELEAGRKYILTFESDSLPLRIFLRNSSGYSRFWNSGEALTLTSDDLMCSVSFFGMNVSGGVGLVGDCRIFNIQIEEGTVATEYEPYDPEYVEIIPPLYTFTCSDAECGAVWTKEAEYQGATVTYTCTRCGSERTEAAGADAGLFVSIGNLIADGITWATDKLTELVQSLSGLTDIFDAFAESVKNSAGQFPVFLGAMFALLPEDLMNVFWFGLVAFIIIAVWKKWFS